MFGFFLDPFPLPHTSHPPINININHQDFKSIHNSFKFLLCWRFVIIVLFLCSLFSFLCVRARAVLIGVRLPAVVLCFLTGFCRRLEAAKASNSNQFCFLHVPQSLLKLKSVKSLKCAFYFFQFPCPFESVQNP